VTVYVLPELNYDYAALEPVISGEIMELHHDKHHAAYVTGANTTLDKLAAARDADDFSGIVGLEKTLAFNLAGHALHIVFWRNLSPDGGDRPDGELAAAIDEFFGSFEKMKAQMTAAASTVQGSGWGVLAFDHVGQRLLVHQLYDHHANLSISTTPLLVFDVWEHAFYLQYKNAKPDYVQNLWKIVNWADVNERFLTAGAAADCTYPALRRNNPGNPWCCSLGRRKNPAGGGGEMTVPQPAHGPVPISYPTCAHCSHTWHGLPCPVLTSTKTTPTCACPTSLPMMALPPPGTVSPGADTSARTGAGGLRVPSTM